MAKAKSKLILDDEGLVPCPCGIRTTTGAVASGWGTVLNNQWYCPVCVEMSEAEVRRQLEEDIPF